MSREIMEQMRVAFRAELMDLLAELDTAILSLEAEPENIPFVHRVFRAVHTIKGSGATAGFNHLAKFGHKFEEAFDLARSGRLAVSVELIDAALKGCDVMRTIVAEPDETPPSPVEEEVLQSLSRLVIAVQGTPAPKAEEKQASPTSQVASDVAYEVVMRPRSHFFASGSDPVTLLDEMRTLGQAHITAHADAVPLFDALEPETCYLWWSVLLVSASGEASIRSVFDFVEDDCDVTIRPLEDQASSIALLGAIPIESMELFMGECEDRLDEIEHNALELEREGAVQSHIHALFRAVHSIKGNCGILLSFVADKAVSAEHPLRQLGDVAHATETLLEPYRNGKPLTGEVAALVLDIADAMRRLFSALSGRASNWRVSPELRASLGLQQLQPERPATNTNGAAAAFRNTATQCFSIFEHCWQQFDKGERGEAIWRMYQRALKTLSGAAAHLKHATLSEALAEQTRIVEAAISGGTVADEEFAKLNAALQHCRNVADSRDSAAPAAPSAPPAPTATPPPAEAKSADKASSTVRIEQEKLDRLMRVVGELLVARGVFPTLAQKLIHGEDQASLLRTVNDAGTGISRIAEELQATVMSIRMLPMKTILQRFPRLVRDLARNLGKEIQLIVEGEDTELDKTILEQIADPLVHLVRNAADHGLETPAERRAAGKNPAGRLTLRAANEAGGVVLQISDDGRGLAAEKLKQKALEKGLISPEQARGMSLDAAYQLIFLPGFSTADQVTDVSGRGVGMDVVLNNVRSLQGTIEIQSSHGKGTTFSIKLPTSLMVTKGILLTTSGQEYILPLTAITDMVKIPKDDLHSAQGVRLAHIRGQIYPIVDLARAFGLPPTDLSEISIAVVESAAGRYGLAVDKFLSEVEVLVKPLAGGLSECKEFHGAAIMGDGRVVLVLNPRECSQTMGAGA